MRDASDQEVAESDRVTDFDKQGGLFSSWIERYFHFIDGKDFVSSITLAGAAEEILSTLVTKVGGAPCVTDQARRLIESKLPHL